MKKKDVNRKMKKKLKRNRRKSRCGTIVCQQSYGLQDDGFMMNAGLTGNIMSSIF